jgi:hypothetical protein
MLGIRDLRWETGEFRAKAGTARRDAETLCNPTGSGRECLERDVVRGERVCPCK